MPCNPLAICPQVTDGNIASCQANCACRFCGDANGIAQCNSRCVGSGAQAIQAINQGTAQVNQQIANQAGAAANSALSGLLAPLYAGIYPFMERVALFIFAMILVIVGFLIVKQ